MEPVQNSTPLPLFDTLTPDYSPYYEYPNTAEGVWVQCLPYYSSSKHSFVSRDVGECKKIYPCLAGKCPPGWKSFSNACGCGCLKEDLIHYCKPHERRLICPPPSGHPRERVCGVNTTLRCKKFPCPSPYKIYDHGCAACSDPDVDWYVKGLCPPVPLQYASNSFQVLRGPNYTRDADY